jgi:hypothetical protein
MWSYDPLITPDGNPMNVGTDVATPAVLTPGTAVQQWMCDAVFAAERELHMHGIGDSIEVDIGEPGGGRRVRRGFIQPAEIGNEIDDRRVCAGCDSYEKKRQYGQA